ncbi:hypothetical protein ES703_95272 [subsurface metagenome]
MGIISNIENILLPGIGIGSIFIIHYFINNNPQSISSLYWQAAEIHIGNRTIAAHTDEPVLIDRLPHIFCF